MTSAPRSEHAKEVAHCPFCKTELGDDFGLVECPSCHKASLIDVDGQLVEAANETIFEDFQFGVDVPTPASKTDVIPSDPPPTDPDSASFSDSSSTSDSDSVSTSDSFSDPASASASASDSDSFSDSPPPPSSFESIANSSRTTSAHGHDGNLRYNLTISGVDTADLRKELLEALTDRKFLWDAESIVKSIRNGQLKIVDLNAVKAAVLVARLKSLPFQVSWEQHALQTN